MKILLVCFVLNSLFVNAQVNLQYRQKNNIDADWKFHAGDVIGAQKASFNDSSWRMLHLPHDWSIEGEFSRANPGGSSVAYLPTGIGWYRKVLEMPANSKGKHVIIQFDGVYMNSDVWVNDHFIGRYPNGFNSFYYDISEFIRGGNNTIAVRVDNSNQPSARWYPGSGIYRHVWLTITDPLHIEQWGSTVTTKEITAKEATIQVATKIRVGPFPRTKWFFLETDTSKNKRITKRCSLTTKIFDDQNNLVGQNITQINVEDFSKQEIKQEIKITNPDLWSLTTPKLYKAYSVLATDSAQVDDCISSFGIRKITLDPVKGFKINGSAVKVKGACIHQDAGPLGRVIPRKIWVQKLQVLKDMGANAVRNHCANSPEFFDVCDSMGLLAFNDAFDEWSDNFEDTKSESPRGKVEYGYHKYFDQWAETDLRNFIRRDKNHPSIFIWSLGNEIPEQYLQTADATNKLKNLIRISREEDPTRPTTVALEGNVLKKLNNNFTDLVDVAGFNYVEMKNPKGRYAAFHKKHPDKMILGTETYYSLGNWLAAKNNNYVIGEFVWVGIDYLGEGGRYPSHGWEDGLIDINLNPKPEYYFRKSLWSDKPMAYLAIGEPHTNAKYFWDMWDMPNVKSTWNWEENKVQKVNCYTNCEEAELFLNGKSLGIKYMKDFEDQILKWDVMYAPGTLEVIGRNKSKKVTVFQLETVGKPSAIKLTLKESILPVKKNDIAVFDIEIVDDKGRTVSSADNLLSFEVSGEGYMAASNANLSDSTSFRSNTMKAFGGKCQVFVQSLDRMGNIGLTVKSEGLGTASLKVPVQ